MLFADAWHRFCFNCRNNFSSDVLHNSTFPGEETHTWPQIEKTAGSLFKVITNCRVTAILTKEPGTAAWFLHELGRPSRSDIFLLCRTTVSSDAALSYVHDFGEAFYCNSHAQTQKLTYFVTVGVHWYVLMSNDFQSSFKAIFHIFCSSEVTTYSICLSVYS